MILLSLVLKLINIAFQSYSRVLNCTVKLVLEGLFSAILVFLTTIFFTKSNAYNVKILEKSVHPVMHPIHAMLVSINIPFTRENALIVQSINVLPVRRIRGVQSVLKALIWIIMRDALKMDHLKSE